MVNEFTCTEANKWYATQLGMTILPQNAFADMLHDSCRPKPGSTAADPTSSADSLQQMAHRLAASKQAKSAAVMWSRALMHQLAAQAHCQDGMSKLGWCTRLLVSSVTRQADGAGPAIAACCCA